MRTKLNLEASKRSLVLVSVGAGIALLTCGAIAAVGLSQIHSLDQEVSQKQTQVDDGRQIATRLAESEKRYLDSQNELRFLELTASTRAYIPTMLKQLEALGRTVNLKVVAVRPVVEPAPPVQLRPAAAADAGKNAQATAPKPQKPPYDTQRIDITAEGSYANALSFLYHLTTFPKIVTVNSVEMTPVGGGGGNSVQSGQLEIHFNITAFVLSSASASAPPPGAGTAKA